MSKRENVVPAIEKLVCKRTGARRVDHTEELQELWSGYGMIWRFVLEGGRCDSVVVKHVQVPTKGAHPRGWNTGISHQRKLKSYRVETDWYRNWSRRCLRSSRVPECLATEKVDGDLVLILEDLDASGFPVREHNLSFQSSLICLRWLAYFHANFMHQKPDGLWKVGTYWHLDTRPDELAALDDPQLKAAAPQLDLKLKRSPFQTIVHGDAKLANFCFTPAHDDVAAVDFQYVGGGCGMKDVAYFIGSCFSESECEHYESDLLSAYFNSLKDAIDVQTKEIDFDALEEDWRGLFPVAWADFHRFLKGWSPGHYKINSYSERLSRAAVALL